MTESIVIRIDKESKKKIKEIALKDRRILSDFLRLMFEYHILEYKKQKEL